MAARSAWTAERVLALAPDPAAARAGRGLTALARWSSLGQGPNVIWGECLGSGGKPYQVRVALDEPAFRCSCPSRKFPCKHAVALMLIWLDPATPVAAEADPPPWVTAWVEARAAATQARPAPARIAAATVADPAGRRKREAARTSKVAAGLEDLDLWLGDLIRAGFGALSSRPRNLWDEQARRLVDAQCPGVARRLRQIDAMGRVGEGWQAALLDRLAQLHLLIAGFRHRESLPPAVLEDVRTAIGFPVDLDAVRSGASGTAVRDIWHVLGQAYTLDEKITVRRTSFWGHESRRSAIILDFAAPGRPFEATFAPGTALDATLAFLPGAAPVRALVTARHGPPTPVESLDGGSTLAEAQAAFGAMLACSPWVELVPVVLAAITLRSGDDGWAAVDFTGAMIPLTPRFAHGWHLEALSGGAVITLAAEFDGATLNPLSAVVAGRFVALVPPGKPTVADPLGGAPGRWLTPESAVLAEATAAAVVGVDRKPPPTLPGDHPVGSILGGTSSQPAASRLLALAAAGGLYARVGRQPATIPAEPSVPAPPTEERPECGTAAARRLRGILAEDAAEIKDGITGRADEWCAACDQAGQRLPADLLVEVLTLFQRRADRVAALRPILGQRGHWLASRNPDWHRFASPPPLANRLAVWETGTRAERLALLRSLRGTDVDAARRLVATTFAAEPAALRAEIIAFLSVNLADPDEPLLEAALDDRSRDVRAAAVAQLGTLAGSRFATRMADRARSFIRWEGARLAVDPPDRADAAMARDGITADPQPGRMAGDFRPGSVGPRAWYLYQILAQTPPAQLADHLARPPEVLLAACRSTEWGAVMVSAWQTAALRYRDLAWAEVLTLDQITRDDGTEGSTFSHLLALLDPATRAARIATRLARDSTPVGLARSSIALIQMTEGHLAIDLGRTLLDRIARALRAERDAAGQGRPATPRAWLDDPLRLLVEELSDRLPFELIEETELAIVPDLPPPTCDVSPTLARSFRTMLDQWKFRRDLHQEFAP